MKIYFYASDKPREQSLAEAFLYGVAKARHTVKKCGAKFDPNDVPDVACMVGVKSLKLWRKAEKAGCIPVMFDKSYSRDGWDNWRVSPFTHNPSKTLHGIVYPSDRWLSLGYNSFRGWKRNIDGHILIAGSSEKYHNFYGLENPNDYASSIVTELCKHTDRKIIYRPKPSWGGAVKIEGAELSHNGKKFCKDLEGARLLVTHGSNACFEAALSGIPTIILGNGVMRSVSPTRINAGFGPPMLDPTPVFHGLAYHQWTLGEMKKGKLNELFGRWFDGFSQGRS